MSLKKMICQSFIQNSCYRIHVFKQFCSNATNMKLKNQKGVRKKVSQTKIKSNETNVSIEIRNFLEECGVKKYIDFIPNKILRRKCEKTSLLYLINRDTAKSLASMISKDLLDDTTFLIECNPGLGLLTQELLNIGIPTINLFEKYEEFLKPKSPLNLLFNQYNPHLCLKKLNIFDIWMTLLRDKFNNDNFGDTFMSNFPNSKWKNSPFAKFIVSYPNREFISLFIHNFYAQTKIFDHGRPTFFMVLPSFIWQKFCATNLDEKNIRYYTHYSVMIHLFFNFEYLGELPRKSFMPWPTVKASKRRKFNELEFPMYVIKLEPKSHLPHIIKKDDLKAFWYFLKHIMRTRKYRVIKELEKLVPGCGPRLIQHDFNICTRFKELSPKVLLELFKEFRTWPEYDESLFIPIRGSADVLKKEDEDKLEAEIEQNNEISTAGIQNSNNYLV